VSYARGFLTFWYDFIIGDDWSVAAAVAAALAVTYWLAHVGVQAWWLLPAVVVLVTGLSTYRATLRARPAAVRAVRRRR
jgi:hypothetical protein